MENKKWYNNEKDLATKPLFNYIWFVIFISCLTIGIKATTNQIDWKSLFIVVFSFTMLFIQHCWLMEILELHNKKHKEVK